MRHSDSIKRMIEARVPSTKYPKPTLTLFRFNFRFPCCNRYTYKNISIPFVDPLTAPPVIRPVHCHKCNLDFDVTVSVAPNKHPKTSDRGPRAKTITSYEFNFAPNPKKLSIKELPLYPKLCKSKCKNYTHCKRCVKCRCFMRECGALTR